VSAKGRFLECASPLALSLLPVFEKLLSADPKRQRTAALQMKPAYIFPALQNAAG
jgi:hypothetical protein